MRDKVEEDRHRHCLDTVGPALPLHICQISWPRWIYREHRWIRFNYFWVQPFEKFEPKLGRKYLNESDSKIPDTDQTLKFVLSLLCYSLSKNSMKKSILGDFDLCVFTKSRLESLFKIAFLWYQPSSNYSL